jgi:D-alanine-D-alanine ligase-like ATP-grasp enzyme
MARCKGCWNWPGLPYVGAGVVGSAVGMDKAIFKQVMAANGLPVLPWLLVQRRGSGGNEAVSTSVEKPPF